MRQELLEKEKQNAILKKQNIDLKQKLQRYRRAMAEKDKEMMQQLTAQQYFADITSENQQLTASKIENMAS